MQFTARDLSPKRDLGKPLSCLLTDKFDQQQTQTKGLKSPSGRWFSNKTVLVMKLTSFLIIVACLQVSARGLSQTVTFSGKDVPLEKVFSVIKEQTGYLVFFDYAVLDGSKTVTLSVKDAPLQDFLKQLLQGQLLDFV